MGEFSASVNSLIEVFSRCQVSGTSLAYVSLRDSNLLKKLLKIS